MQTTLDTATKEGFVEQKIIALANTLAGSMTFENAATSTLQSMLQMAEDALSTTPYAGKGRVLRGMVHLRPGDGYRRLVVVEHRPVDGNASKPAPPSYLPSFTAWRWVEKHRCAVAIDVNTGQVTLDLNGGAASALSNLQPIRFDSQRSRVQLLGREASHILVLPLRSPGGNIDGMISLEIDCRAAMGKTHFLDPNARTAFQTIINIASPYLTTLPLAPTEQTPPNEFLPVVGVKMEGVIKMLQVFARLEEIILLSGPTGAGKSKLARWCHEQSPQRNRPFEIIDLATVPHDLQKAELFGWKRGAFTGSVKDTPGCIARAEGGTLFIDEIDKLSLETQAALLRVLDERRYRPVGAGAGDVEAHVRFIIGTNADLPAAVQVGHFLEDLYYRINVLPVKVLPLEERKDEIRPWAEYMLTRRHRVSKAEGKAHISDEAEHVLMHQRWPGNLRQLDNIVRRAYALALIDYDADHEAPPAEIVLEARHFHEALTYEGTRENKSLLELLHLAAAEFVEEAERRKYAGSTLNLDLASALPGLVLAAAAGKLGSKEEAFRLLGKENVVKMRNHVKTWKHEMEKVETLYQNLGGNGAPIPHDPTNNNGNGEA